MVDPRMAQAIAVHAKIATIAIIRFSMVVCAPTLSAATPTYLMRLALSSTFRCKVKVFGDEKVGIAGDAWLVSCGATFVRGVGSN